MDLKTICDLSADLNCLDQLISNIVFKMDGIDNTSFVNNGDNNGGDDKIINSAVLKPPLISDQLTYIMELAIVVFGLYLTSLFGVAANSINLFVYTKQGLRDSITVGLFALSLSDLVLVIMPLLTASCHAAEFLLPNSSIDFPSIHYATSGWIRNAVYSMSCIITTVLSLERCCCIILPFHVKVIFSRKRTITVIFITFLIHLTALMILPLSYELRWWSPYENKAASEQNSTSGNKSWIFRVVLLKEGELIEVMNTTFMSLAIPTVTQVIVTICVVIMAHGLRKSAKFRSKAMLRNFNNTERNQIETTNDSKLKINDKSSSHETFGKSGMVEKGNNPTNASKEHSSTKTENGADGNQLSQRDRRLIRTMVFLVCIQSACNIPFLAATFAWRTIPDLNIGMAYENMLKVVFSIVYLLGNLNASGNVFVYYFTSSSFSVTLREAKCCFSKSKQ